MYFQKCPRCGDQNYELLKTHAHCFGCNYSPEEDIGYLAWRDIELKGTKAARRQQIEDARIQRGEPLDDYEYGGCARSVL